MRAPPSRIALVTWDAVARPHEVFRGLADSEDGAIVRALRARGASVDRWAWSSPEVDWSAYDLVMVRTTWDYFDHLPEFRAWLARVAPLGTVWNRPEVVSWNADKRYLFELEDRGVPLPATARAARGESVDLAALMSERGWREVVIKRVVTAAAAGQMRVAANDAAVGQRHLDQLLADGDALVQAYLPSVASHGEVSLVAIAGDVIHAVRKVPAGGDYRSQPNFGARALLHRPSGAELELAARALAAVGQPTLHARVDMVALDDGSPALMELELIEPYLFLDVDPGAVERLADRVMAHCRR